MSTVKKTPTSTKRRLIKKRWLKKHSTEKTLARTQKVKEQKHRIYLLDNWNIFKFVKKRDCTFLPFDIISHPAFITFDITSGRRFYFSTFCLIRCLLPRFLCPFVIIYHEAFCPFDDFYHLTLFPSIFCLIRRFVCRCFSYHRRFSLRHFVGESSNVEALFSNIYCSMSWNMIPGVW
jgi:hypothetical protein